MQQWQRSEFLISTDPGLVDVAAVEGFLRQSYWARERPFETIRRSVENSLPFGLYKGGRMVGFARVVTDYATFAWLADVFLDEEFRGLGLGEWLVETALAHEDLRGLRRWMLATRDAHALYRKFGFECVEGSTFYMERIEGPPIV
jgi:GNAT superfamily N-acetyltransferase